MTTIIDRKTRKTYEGELLGGSGGLFNFKPDGLPTATFSTEQWEIVPGDALESFGADYPPPPKWGSA